jgi:hypothetical protein
MDIQSRYVQPGGLNVQTLELLVSTDKHVFVEKPKFDKIENWGKLAHLCWKSIELDFCM